MFKKVLTHRTPCIYKWHTFHVVHSLTPIWPQLHGGARTKGKEHFRAATNAVIAALRIWYLYKKSSQQRMTPASSTGSKGNAGGTESRLPSPPPSSSPSSKSRASLHGPQSPQQVLQRLAVKDHVHLSTPTVHMQLSTSNDSSHCKRMSTRPSADWSTNSMTL